ncbi:MAG: hypothetical protein K6T29_08855 [Peptococcaceae bacterium]|nr:hypothetical protein [Peptococcaceae bacterium]
MFKFRRSPVAGSVKTPGRGFLLGGIAAAVVAGFLVYQALAMAVPSVPVLVTRKNLAPGEAVAKENLDVVKMPRSLVTDDRITGADLNGIIGKHARTYVAAGDPLRRVHIAEFAPGGGTVAARVGLVDRNLMAVALPPDATKGLLAEQGDRVDIAAVLDVPNAARNGAVTTSKIIVRGAPVIHVPVKNPEDNREQGITVGLSPEDAEKVALAMVKGKVVAMINPAGSSGHGPTVGVSMDRIFQ